MGGWLFLLGIIGIGDAGRDVFGDVGADSNLLGGCPCRRGLSVSEVSTGSSFEVDGRPIARRGVGKGTAFCLLRRRLVLARVLSPIAGRR